MLETVRRFLFTHNQATYREAFDEYFTPDCIVHDYLAGRPDAMPCAVYEQFIASFRAALPNIHNKLEDGFANGDRVTLRRTGYSTYTGADRMQVPASGKSAGLCLALHVVPGGAGVSFEARALYASPGNQAMPADSLCLLSEACVRYGEWERGLGAARAA